MNKYIKVKNVRMKEIKHKKMLQVKQTNKKLFQLSKNYRKQKVWLQHKELLKHTTTVNKET